MGKKLASLDSELYERTDEVLHYVWDPIGIADAPMARDEYHAYLPRVFRLLKANASAEKIADYLFQVETKSMGLGGNKQRNIRIAELLLKWKDIIFENRAS